MNNLFDYLSWRGDLSFAADGFNDIDAVILSRLSYLPFDGIVSEDLHTTITVSQAADRMFSGDAPAFLWEGDDRLMQELALSDRFGDLQLSGYVNIVDDERQMQFSALLITLDERTRFVSFRGTDNTLVGWQEDFNMFFTFPVASQPEALRYFEKAAGAFDGSFYLGGHSKGGNLAVYAASFCGEDLQERIREIYSMDGPGFELEHILDSGFYRVIDRIHTYVPQSSIFGMLFEHEEKNTVIQSGQKGFLQHDVYSWAVERTRLVELEQTNGTSAFFDRTLTRFLAEMPMEKRKEFTEELFALLRSSDEVTFDEMAENPVRDAGRMFKSLAGLDSSKRSLLISSVLRFIKAAGGTVTDMKIKENKSKRFRKT
ncbi:MAG: DUF2974 domain-containing protein [Ruminococcus sp.]|nr:DUF2974 domain-containing protein [Ruminococcus sp.]